MSEVNRFYISLRESPGIRLAVLFCSFFILLSITSFCVYAIDFIPFGSLRDKGLAASALQNLLAFCLPALIVARFCSLSPFKWLQCDNIPNYIPFAGVVIVYLLSLPAMEWLINWNSNIHFPESLSNLEETLRNWEENSAQLTSTLLDAGSFGSVLTGVLIIGVLTGFSEELFFRGALQGILQRSSVGKNMAVWMSAFIFSSLHFQFFGFIPRLLMGAFFGYLLIWTRSIWVPVLAHALNNSVVVITAGISDNPADISQESLFPVYESMPGLLPLTSAVLTALFLVCFRGYFFKKRLKTDNSHK